MKAVDKLYMLRKELDAELRGHILRYWSDHAVDSEHGGFIGRIDSHNRKVEFAHKGAILNTRILWTYSAVHGMFNDSHSRELAGRAYAYIERYFRDGEHGGLYWLLDHLGTPSDTKKHTYAQAFAIYGYSEYYKATAHKPALDRAVEIFNLLEHHSYDRIYSGYHEAFTRDWEPLDDARLSADNVLEKRSMNTHIHLLEAYANLYRIWPGELLRERLKTLVELFLGPIYDAKNHHFHSFFNEKWNPKSLVYSYGHDIEASWLISDAARTLGETRLVEETDRLAREIASTTLDEGVDERYGGVFYLGEGGRPVDTDKQWWAQAEAIVGFLDVYQKTSDEVYLDAALRIWSFTKEKIIDHTYGDWFYRIAWNGKPYLEEDKIGPWKCPYHTVRACLEVINRIEPDPAYAEHQHANFIPGATEQHGKHNDRAEPE